MGNIDGTNVNALCILKILEEFSDYEHPLMQKDIIDKMKSEYGIEIARNAVARNLNALKELGYSILRRSGEEDGKKGCYLADRDFEDSEIVSLIDSVLSSRYIPERAAADLISKLSGLSTVYFRKKLPQVYTVADYSHQRGTQFFYNLEVFHKCITEKRQVEFTYNRPDRDGKLRPVRDHKDVVNPYALVCANSQYYLIASAKDYDNILHYRVDRITDIKPLETPSRDVREIPETANGLNVGEYASKHNLMFSGRAQAVVIKIRNNMLTEVFDTFDRASTRITDMGDGYSKVTVFAAPLGVRIWAMQFGDVCEILSPESLRNDIRKNIRRMAEKYGVDLDGKPE